jgi:hypothetical protein
MAEKILELNGNYNDHHNWGTSFYFSLLAKTLKRKLLGDLQPRNWVQLCLLRLGFVGKSEKKS